MAIKHLAALAVALMVSAAAPAQATERMAPPPSQNPADFDPPFLAAVWVGDTLYVSGWLDPDLATHPDTRSQTVGILHDLQKFLASQNLTLGDVVTMREYLGGDPTKDGEADVLGARAGYAQVFGVTDQPDKPAGPPVRMVLLSAARGALVGIDLVAVRPKLQLSRRAGG